MGDVYEKIQYKGERPEYVLKNGKAINVYGMLIDVHSMQDEIEELRTKITKKGEMVSDLTEALCASVDETAELREGLKLMIEQFKSEHNCEYEYKIIKWNEDLLNK